MYTLFRNLSAEVSPPPDGILSRTIHNAERVKMVLFGFSAGQELSAHTAPMPATIFLLQGEALVTLGSDRHELSAGACVHMQPDLRHGIQARTPLVMLLLLIKDPPG